MLSIEKFNVILIISKKLHKLSFLKKIQQIANLMKFLQLN